MRPLLRLPRFVETGLLLAFVLAVYLVPRRLPVLPTSLHGLLLLPLFAIALIAHSDRIFARRALPYWAMLAVTLLSAAIAGHYGRDTFRPLVFGLMTALSVAAVGRPGDLRILFFVMVPLLVLDGMLGAVNRLSVNGLPGFVDGLPVVGRALHRGTFLVVGMLAVGTVYLRTRRSWLLLPFTVLALGAVVTALRGIWLAGAAGLLVLAVLDRRPRALVLIGCAALTFVGAEKYMVQKADASAVPPAPTRALEPAPTRPQSQTGAAKPSPVRPAPAGAGSQTAATTASDRHALGFKAKLGWAKFAEELTSAGRFGYWQAGFRMTRDHPLFGVGPGNFPERSTEYRPATPSRDAETTSDPHSVYVGILAELGLAGAACLALILWGAFLPLWRLRHSLRARPELVATATAMAALCAAGLTWDLHVQRVWWIALALVALAAEQDTTVSPA